MLLKKGKEHTIWKFLDREEKGNMMHYSLTERRKKTHLSED